MARFLRFAVSIFCLPFVWALCLTFVDSFSMMSGPSQGLFSIEAIALFAGLVAFLPVWMFAPDPVKIYVLGHELTHALWGMFFGARVGSLKVGARGGSVTLSKSNVWITLSPYFFPFWTAVVGVIALAVRCVRYFTHPETSFPMPWLWMFAVGFTWCFHVCFTVKSLMQTQPDVMEYGRIFSWTLILVCNLSAILLWIVCTTDVSLFELSGELWRNTKSVYLSLAAWAGRFSAIFDMV